MMPCFTLIKVKIKDLQIAKDVIKHFGMNTTITPNSDNTYNVSFTRGKVTEADFKTEYGLRIAEKQARQKYGYKARIWRGIEKRDNKEYKTLYVKTS